MQLRLGMTAGELLAYREYSGCSLQYITKELDKLKMLERIEYAENIDDIKEILRRMLSPWNR